MNIKAEINEIEYENERESQWKHKVGLFFFKRSLMTNLERLKNSKRGNLQINQYQE